MRNELERLGRWLQRARPSRAALLRALLSNLIASLTNVGLLVGAVGLLVESANRPGLKAVGGALIVIELLAFLRSPIRFNERLSSHHLGFQAVSQWRRWLVASVGSWNYSRWRSYATGDLLERSLKDTDELQDLWLRFFIPLIGALTTAVIADVVVGLLPPHGQWWGYAGLLLGWQLLGLFCLLANVGPMILADRALRTAKSSYRATLLELGAVTPELSLLGFEHYASSLSTRSRQSLAVAEAEVRRRRRVTAFIPLLGTSGMLLTLFAVHPQSSPLWIVVVALLSFSSYEGLTGVRHAVDVAVAISGAAERLESLEKDLYEGEVDFPDSYEIELQNISLQESGKTLLRGASLQIPAGQKIAITGPSGIGKSTLLRAIASLENLSDGVITIGNVPLFEIEEGELREHLAYMPSDPGLLRGYAVDVIGLGRTLQRDALKDLADVGIIATSETKWEDLSRGEKERVSVVRSMVTEPRILILDEPTSGLGVSETQYVLELLASTTATVIVATHDPQVMQWCDEIYELSNLQLRSI